MALDTAMKLSVKRSPMPYRTTPSQQGWKPDEYRILYCRVPMAEESGSSSLSKISADSRHDDVGSCIGLSQVGSRWPTVGHSLGIWFATGLRSNQGGTLRDPTGYIDHRSFFGLQVSTE